MRAKRWPSYHHRIVRKAGGHGSDLFPNCLGFISEQAFYARTPQRVSFNTVCRFQHSGELARSGSFGPIRLSWSRSVKRHPQLEDMV